MVLLSFTIRAIDGFVALSGRIPFYDRCLHIPYTEEAWSRIFTTVCEFTNIGDDYW